MKKQLLSILSLLGYFSLTAQITVTQTDIASPGTTIFRGIDTAYTETPIGPGGSNMTWDFSGIVDDLGDTVMFVDPSTLANFSSFSTANLGIIITGQGTAYAIKDGASLRIVGQEAVVQGQPIAAPVNPAEIIVPFPSNFNNTWNNTSVSASPAIAVTALTGVDSGRVTITKTKNVTVDAWGSLITPLGTYSVIRQKEALSTDQNIEIHTTGPFPPAGWYPYQNTTTTSTSFLYWANGLGFPLMQADSADAGNVDITWLIQSTTGIKENVADKNSRVYPNPANDRIYIMLDQNDGVNISIYDVQGKLVKQVESKGAVADVEVNNLEKGMYTYKVTSKNNTTAGKFIIAR